MFIPTPPKISLPITIPKLVPIATCHKGMVAGKVSGIKAQVTKKPSEMGCRLTTANRISHTAPVANVTVRIGSILKIPERISLFQSEFSKP